MQRGLVKAGPPLQRGVASAAWWLLRRDRQYGLCPGRAGIKEDASETFAEQVKVR